MNLKIKSLLCCVFLIFSVSLFAENEYTQTTVEGDVNSTKGTLAIQTNVEKVEVYINNVYKGYAPIVLDDLTPGMYLLTLEKKGYEEKTAFINVEAGVETKLYFELERLLGFLRITSNIDNADIYLNSTLFDNIFIYSNSALSGTPRSRDTGIFKLPEGIYTVEIRKFGYEPITKTVVVLEDTLSSVSFEVKKSLLSIQSFNSRPDAFNPTSPQLLGETSFSFSVNAPCTASLEIYNDNNSLIYTSMPKKVSTSSSSFSWDGRNTFGSVMPEGRYTAVLHVIPFDGWKTVNADGSDTLYASTTTLIDATIFYPLVAANIGGTSTGIPTPRILPKNTCLFTIAGNADFSLDTGYTVIPFSFDVVYTPLSALELSFRLGFEPHDTGEIPVFFGGALKYATQLYPFYLGGLLRYTYSSEPIIVTGFSEPGLGLGFLTGFEVENYLFSFSEEVVFGSSYGNILDFDGQVKTGFSVQFQKESFSTNTWVSLYSPFNFDGISLFGNVETGLDVSYLIPNTSVSPTIGINYNYSSHGAHNIRLRFGLNMLVL